MARVLALIGSQSYLAGGGEVQGMHDGYCSVKETYKAFPQNSSTHCKENSIYVFLFWKLCGPSPNFHIHVPVSDLYIPWISPHIFLQQNRQIRHGNI
jgi:hypothetical protein